MGLVINILIAFGFVVLACAIIRIVRMILDDYRFFKQIELESFNEGIELSVENLKDLIKKEDKLFKEAKVRIGGIFPLSRERATLSGLNRALNIKKNKIH